MISAATTQLSGTPDPVTLASTTSDYAEHHQVQTGSRNCTQTGSTNNLATETDIDAISVAIPMFWGKVFTGVYVDFAQHFLHAEIPRWRTYTEVVITFATENDTKVISTAVAMFQARLIHHLHHHRYCPTRHNTTGANRK